MIALGHDGTFSKNFCNLCAALGQVGDPMLPYPREIGRLRAELVTRCGLIVLYAAPGVAPRRVVPLQEPVRSQGT